MSPAGEEAKVRIDKWLWAARFFKTRSTASKAVSGGHVQVNGQRVKPSRLLKPGDRLDIRRGQTAFEVDVLELRTRRGPAVVARTLYEETAGSISRREEELRTRRLQRAAEKQPAGKPDKRERRKIRKFLRRD